MTEGSTIHGQVRRILSRQLWLRERVLRRRARTLSELDVYVAAYPKSGSTWARFLIARALGARPDFQSIATLVPHLGWHGSDDALRTPEGSRLVKVHEQPALLHRTPPRRALVVVRDGRDVAVSYFHHLQREGWTFRSFPEFLGLFMAGRLDAYGVWSEHVGEWLNWPRRTLVMRYEDLLVDGAKEVLRITEFLGLTLSYEQAEQVYFDCSLQRMRQAETSSSMVASSGKRIRPTAGFVRRAHAGEWQEVFDDASRTRFAAQAGEALRRLGYM